jgi:predicted acyl esterase
MADLIPQNFPFSASPYTVSADAYDIITRTSFKAMQCFRTNEGDYMASTTFACNDGETTATEEINFTTDPLEGSIVLQNTVFVQALLGARATGGSPTVTTAKFRLLKWDGTTETSLTGQITADTADSTSTTASAGVVQRVLVALDLTNTREVIKQGEQIRLEVDLTVALGTGSASGHFFHDPISEVSGNSAADGLNKNLIVYLPYVQDV